MSTRGVLLASTPAGVEGMWSAASDKCGLYEVRGWVLNVFSAVLTSSFSR